MKNRTSQRGIIRILIIFSITWFVACLGLAPFYAHIKGVQRAERYYVSDLAVCTEPDTKSPSRCKEEVVNEYDVNLSDSSYRETYRTMAKNWKKGCRVVFAPVVFVWFLGMWVSRIRDQPHLDD